MYVFKQEYNDLFIQKVYIQYVTKCGMINVIFADKGGPMFRFLLISGINLVTCFNCLTMDPSGNRGQIVSHIAEPLVIHGFHQEFVRITGGRFLMGSDERPDEKPVHPVEIDSFDLATSEVTVRQFRVFVQATGYKTDAENSGHSYACCWRPKLGISWQNPGFMQNEDEPVVTISWNDAVAYCRWLSEETGQEYRLPGEAEWEYVCRTGNENERDQPLDSVAWYRNNSEGRTHVVASKRGNDLGLFDMRGNSWEWIQDVYHENYVNAPTDGKPWMAGGSEAQRGYLKPGDGRVLRGGSWGLASEMHPVSYDLRITSRPVFGRNNSCNNSGFRIARSIPVPNQGKNLSYEGPYKLKACGIEYEMVQIFPGQYIMGSETGDRTSKPVHPVYFKRSFRIGKTEITVGQFSSFVEDSGYITEAEQKGKCWDSDFRSHHNTSLQPGINWRNPGFNQTKDDPVTCISWNDAMAFCIWLSKKTGRNCRLPSEAEWEYACFLGSTNMERSFYPEIAWYYENSSMTTHPVAQKRGNSSGIYDMLGNVSEWMMDIWHPDYAEAPDDGSSWLGDPVCARVCRGGSFERESNEMDPKGRDWYIESEAVVGLGFRIVDASGDDT